jgi:hypothetical protein
MTQQEDRIDGVYHLVVVVLVMVVAAAAAVVMVVVTKRFCASPHTPNIHKINK